MGDKVISNQIVIFNLLFKIAEKILGYPPDVFIELEDGSEVKTKPLD